MKEYNYQNNIWSEIKSHTHAKCLATWDKLFSLSYYPETQLQSYIYKKLDDLF